MDGVFINGISDIEWSLCLHVLNHGISCYIRKFTFIQTKSYRATDELGIYFCAITDFYHFSKIGKHIYLQCDLERGEMNILLPTDFSENAKNAAVYGMNCFARIPCTFHLLYALPAPKNKAEEEKAQVPTEFYATYERFLTFLNNKKVNPQHELKVVFTTNPLIAAVREQVLEKNIDLIIMGTKGLSNKKGNTIGKNTSEVMTKVKCPVLAISEHAVFKEYKEILFPTDYKIDYSGQMLQVLLNFVSVSKARVKILEIFDSEVEPTEGQVESKTQLKNYFLPQIPLSQPFYTSKGIRINTNLMLNDEVDMIALAAKNLDICQKLLNENQSQEVPFIKQLPLLVLH